MQLIIDLETLSTRPDTVITQLAAIAFDIHNGHLGIHSRHECRLDIPDQLILGRHIDTATLLWHRRGRTIPEAWTGTPFRTAMDEVRTFILDRKPTALWAWGKDFERPILEDAFGSLRLPMPFHYATMHCARDVWWLAFGDRKPSIHTHQAMDDCQAELEDLVFALGHLRRGGWATSNDEATEPEVLAEPAPLSTLAPCPAPH